MYLRHGREVFVPEDNAKRNLVMTDDVRSVTPTQRPRWQAALKPHEATDRQLRDYAAERIETATDRREAAIWRAFLRSVNAVCADENPMRLCLAICKGSARTSLKVYVAMNGKALAWLPAVETEATPKLSHIVRESCVNRIGVAPPARIGVTHDDESPRGGIPTKTETQLIRGRKI